MLALPISMPRLKDIIFYQNRPKIELFSQKKQNFQALGAPPSDPLASGSFAPRPPASGGAPPPDPRNSPPSLRTPGYAPG